MNNDVITKLTSLLCRECSNITELIDDCPSEVCPLVEDMMLDCVCHIQAITIELTKAVAGEEHEDGDSVFAPGDLESGKKDKAE